MVSNIGLYDVVWRVTAVDVLKMLCARSKVYEQRSGSHILWETPIIKAVCDVLFR